MWHVNALPYQNKILKKSKKNQKRNIKLRKINKRKKMLVSKCTIISRILNGDLKIERIEQY